MTEEIKKPTEKELLEARAILVAQHYHKIKERLESLTDEETEQ